MRFAQFIDVPLTWSAKERDFTKHGHPYVTLGNEGCFWKLIPHGNHLFTIQTRYGCPKNRHCGKYLNIDVTGKNMRNRATIQQYPKIWEITGFQPKR